MRTLDTSALPSKQIPDLVKWSVVQARLNTGMIANTQLVSNMKNGRHAGYVGDFNSFGVFSYGQFNEESGFYETRIHNHSQTSVDLEEIHPKQGWTIAENWNEWTAVMKGPKGVHGILQLFSDTEFSANDEDKYVIPLPLFILGHQVVGRL